MIESLFFNVLTVTAVISPLLLLLLLFSRRISHSYTAKWSYFVWLILAVRLVIPLNFTLPSAPVSIQVPARISQPITGTQTISAASSQTAAVSSGAATVSSAVPALSAPSGISVMQILSIVWICGIVLFLCFHFAGYFLFLHRVRHWRRPITNPEILKIFAKKREEMHIVRTITLYKCSVINTPMLVGFFKPMILMPDCSVTGEQLGIILTHELIHCKRCDLWYQLLLVFANAMHWFNPFVYLMVRQADHDLELFCDEEVIKNQPILFRQTYGEAILSILRQRSRYKTSFSTNFLGGRKAMKQRFVRLYDNKKRKHGVAAMAIVLCAILITATCIACTSKPASNAPDTASQSDRTVSGSVSSAPEPASSASVNSSASTAQTNTAKTESSSSKPNQNTVTTTTATSNKDIAQKTKDYLLNGQNNKPEAGKLQWSETFLNQVNIDAVYQSYISAGGKAGDIQSFAKYLTENAPIPSNWKTLFEADLWKGYSVKPSRYEPLENNVYQVYVKINGSEVPYVTVRARTGYFHG